MDLEVSKSWRHLINGSSFDEEFLQLRVVSQGPWLKLGGAWSAKDSEAWFRRPERQLSNAQEQVKQEASDKW